MSFTRLQLLSRALTAVLVIALGWQLAWWAWHFITPSLRGNAITQSTAGTTDVALGRQLFGDAGPASAASSGLQSGIRLKGVFAVDGDTLSAAVLNLGGRDLAIRRGEEIFAGATLADVQRDHVFVSRSGVRERIDLDRFENRGAKLAGANGPTAAPVTQFRLKVAATGTNAYALSRQELNNVLQDPRQMAFLGRIGNAASGGVKVEDAPSGSLLDKLGIKTGDVITGLNGQPVNSPGDLARLYQQFGTLTTIRAEVRRGGAPVMLSYAIQN
jgi:general secretion pathway protein C